MKKLFIIATTALLLCTLFFCFSASAVSSGTCGADGNNLIWTLDDSGTLTISGTGEMANWSSSSAAPWYSYRSSIKKVMINDGTTSVGEYAFHKCTSLSSIDIPDGVTSIGNSAFRNCSLLTSINIPDKVTSIGNFAFNNCSSLTNIDIPNSVTSIGESAFQNCSALTKINVDGSNLFYSNDSVGVLFDKEKTTIIQFPTGSTIESYNLPKSVREINWDAFHGNSSLKSIKIIGNISRLSTSTGYPNFTIYGYSGTFLSDYTSVHNIPFVALADNSDYLLILRKVLAGLIVANDEEFYKLDLNSDNILNSDDLVLLRKKIAGLI